MLPSSLKSIYQQYKGDTDSVATWLATTAKIHGYVDKALKSNNPRANSSRPKGKARKRAKATNQPSPSNSITKTTHVIQIKDFGRMARFVAKIDSVHVPDHLSIALERVIRVRKTFHERLIASGAHIGLDSYERHSFFVDVLENVRDSLKPLMGVGVSNVEVTTTAAAKPSEGHLRNMFEVLEVYAPSEKFLNAPDVVVPKSTTEVEYIVEQDDTLEEAIFALVALLDDYDRLRQEIKSLWVAYSAGNLDLAAVSVATNTAFELARSMEDEVKLILTKNGGAANLASSYFFAQCKASGINVQAREQSGDAYNLEAYDVAQPCLINTISLLGSYANGTSDYVVVNSYNGKFGWYDEELGASGKTHRAKWQQDKTAMFEILPDLHFLSSNMGRGAVEDELIRGTHTLMEDPGSGVPLWLAWAAQIYLDILQFLGANCSRGFSEMQEENLRIKKVMIDVPNSSPQRRMALRVATKWDKDPIWTCRKQMIALDLLPGECPPAFKFLRRNPIHCGLLVHGMRVTMHTAGVEYAASPGGLMCIMQLYHALRQEKLLPNELVWEDLETLWKMQGNATFFVGDPPTNREGYFRNYCLSIGASASNWAPTKRKGKFNVNTVNRRIMRFNGWVSLVMNRRLAPTGERPPLSSDLVAGILIEGRRREATNSKGHIQPEIKDISRNEIFDPIKLSPVTLIDKLALDMHAEVPDISYDYFTMHNTAWALLRELKEEFIQLGGVDFLQYIPSEEKLPFVVGFVFSTAAGRKGTTNEEKGEAVDDLINAAAKRFCEFLTKGNGRVIKDRIKAKVNPEDLAKVESDDYDPWKMDKLIAEIEKMSYTRGGIGGNADGQDCPVQ